MPGRSAGFTLLIRPDILIVEESDLMTDTLITAPVPQDVIALRDTLVDWANRHAFPLWWEAGADHRQGGFVEQLDRDGRPTVANRRARVQARQIYTYALAPSLGWTGPAADAVRHGLRFFLTHYQRPDGLFRTLVAPDGAALDDSVVLYDQAFALFALATAHAFLGADGYPEVAGGLEAVAVTLRDALLATRHHPRGGFEEGVPRILPLLSNPHMHLLEACLAWVEAGGDAVWRDVAAEIVGLALDHFIDPKSGGLREYFQGDWRVVDGVKGRIVEPGHQFEWAWLLLRWAALTGDPRAEAAAWGLIKVGEGHGVDAARGVAFNELLDDMSPHDLNARLWPQTERIKAACAAALRSGDPVHWEMAVKGGRGLLRYFDGLRPGLWHDKLRADGTFIDEPSPASSFYHIACAIWELDRTLARAGHPRP